MSVPVADFNTAQGLLELLSGGQFMGAVLGTFTLVLGSWFYLLLILFFDAMIFMRSQSIAVTAVASVAVAGFLYAFLPTEAVAAISLTLTVFFAVALIRFFTGGRD